MPELEDLTLEGKVSTRKPEAISAEIEPSFLDPKDYPKGWLIYDPKLGISSEGPGDPLLKQISKQWGIRRTKTEWQ
jgi:hypothetical protein